MRDDHAGAGGRDRVTEAAAAAVDVHDLLRDAELARLAATGTEQNASLISNRSMSSIDEPGAVERLRDRERRAEAGVARARRPTDAHDTISRHRLQAVRLGVVAASRRTIAAAPSLSPDELPAVTLKPSISGWSGLSVGELLHRRRRGAGARRPRTSRVLAVAALHLDGHDLLLERALVDRLERAGRATVRAHSSTSARVRPISRAVFSPTVIDMSNAGASGVSGWLGDIHSCARRRAERGFIDCGDVDSGSRCRRRRRRLSMPALMLAAAICTAPMPDAQ